MTDITLKQIDGEDFLFYDDGFNSIWYPIKKNGTKWDLPEFDSEDEPYVVDEIKKFHKRSLGKTKVNLTRNSDGSWNMIL